MSPARLRPFDYFMGSCRCSPYVPQAAKSILCILRRFHRKPKSLTTRCRYSTALTAARVTTSFRHIHFACSSVWDTTSLPAIIWGPMSRSCVGIGNWSMHQQTKKKKTEQFMQRGHVKDNSCDIFITSSEKRDKPRHHDSGGADERRAVLWKT